ncbi:MAG: kelch repeat-containing protein [Bacteroidota bacterium]|nr:kelch repeat-containing protein [Bacteroidota bacterium]
MKYYLLVILACVPDILLSQGISGDWKSASSDGFTARYGLTCTVVEGKIYVIGGHTNSGACNILEIYDPLTDTWTTPETSGTFTPRYGLTSAVIGGKIYVMGGENFAQSPPNLNTLEVFDPANSTWSTPSTPGVFTGRAWLTSAVVADKIYVIGGGVEASNTATNIVEVYDPANNRWSTPSTTGTFSARWGLCSAVIADRIYVFGGYAHGALATIEVFDPATNHWSAVSTSGTFTPRNESSACVLNGLVYISGGEDANGNAIDSVDVFDPSTNSWSTLAANGKFVSRQALASASVGGKLYAMGGLDNHTPILNDNQVFTPLPSEVESHGIMMDPVSLSPNPATSCFTISNISSNVTKVLIMDVLGKTVSEVRNIRTSDVTLDLSSLATGTYYFRLISPNSVITRILVKD